MTFPIIGYVIKLPPYPYKSNPHRGIRRNCQSTCKKCDIEWTKAHDIDPLFKILKGILRTPLKVTYLVPGYFLQRKQECVIKRLPPPLFCIRWYASQCKLSTWLGPVYSINLYPGDPIHSLKISPRYNLPRHTEAPTFSTYFFKINNTHIPNLINNILYQ